MMGEEVRKGNEGGKEDIGDFYCLKVVKEKLIYKTTISPLCHILMMLH